MHPTKEGNQWYFGLKAHSGVDANQGTAHTVCTPTANVANTHMLPDPLHGEERKVWADAGYQDQTGAIQQAAPKTQDMTCRRTKFNNYVDELHKKKNQSKSSVRAKVEHPFCILSASSAWKSTLPGHRQEPSPTVRELRPDQPLPASQTGGSARVKTATVERKTGTGMPETASKSNRKAQRQVKNETQTSDRNREPVQRFLRQ